MPSPARKRPKFSPRRVFSAATRTFLTLALATCAFGAAASAQSISISPPANSPNTPEGNNGVTYFEFTVSIDQAPTQNVDVTFTVNNGTAIGSANGTGTDFANSTTGGVLVDGAAPATTNTVRFPANSTASHVIAVPVTGDTAFEPNETFSVSLTSANNGGTIGQANAAATIVNDDNQPFISVTDAAAVTEGGPGATNNANFRVSLSAASGQDVTFTYNTIVTDPNNAGDGNNGDADFTPQNNQVAVIQAGQTFTNIAVPIIGDNIDEANGQFLFEISNVTGANISNAQATGTILDDDGPSVRVEDSTASEGDGQIVFRIQLSAPSPQPITVTYRTGSNSAIAGQDYGTAGGGEVTGSVTFDAFAGDPSTGTAPFIDVPIPVLQDNISEPAEIFSFTLVQADNNTSLTGPGTRRQATGTITDDDGSPDLVLTADSPAGTTEGNQGTNTNALFSVTLSNPSSRTITFRYQTSSGTATAGTDFTTRTGTGTIPALSNAPFRISVPIIGDNIDETNETFSVRIFAAAPGDVTINGGSEQTITGTIIDDDGPIASVVPANVNINEGDNGARPNTAFTVQLNTTSAQPVTVTYTIGSTDANEATRNRDYTNVPVTGTLVFAPGQNTKQVPLSIIGDNVKESNEIITFTLSAPNGGSIGTGTGTITIIDDDATPVINLTGPADTREGSGGNPTRFLFKVSLDRASSVPITVNYAVNDGTAVAGSDFIDPTGGGSNQLVFPAGTTGPQNITVLVTADRLNEDDETFSVTLSGASAGARIGIGNDTATILNDDALPTITIRDSTGDLETGPPPPQGQPQGPRIATFDVFLNTPSGKDVTFTYQTIGAATGNTFTALSGIDFQPVNGQQVTIPAGQTRPTQPLTVTIVSDNLDEDDETYGVVLANVVNANISRGGATGRITDDDISPEIVVEAPDDDNAAVEPYATAVNGAPVNGRNAIFPVTLSAPSGRLITVRYTIAGGANPAAFANDFLANANNTTRFFQSGTITFVPVNGVTPTVRNITLFPRGDDGDEEETQNFVVNINVTNARIVDPADATAGSTVEDRDPGFTNFTPDVGYQTFTSNGVTTLGTIATITGNQFVTDGINRVQAVRFTSPTGARLNANILNVTDTEITFRIPQGAFSSTISVVLTSGRELTAREQSGRRLFIAQPVITSFTPAAGLAGVTTITVTGLHFRDPRNPVTGISFNGTVAGVNILNDTTLTATIPAAANGGPLAIITREGGTGPNSNGSVGVNGFTPGGIQFVNAITDNVYENASATIRTDNGQILNPVRTYTLQLRPATVGNANGAPIPPTGYVDVRVNITVPAGFNQRSPILQIDPRVGRIQGVSIIRPGASDFTLRIAAGTDPNTTIPILLTYAGDDNQPPAAQGSLSGATDEETGLTLPADNSGTTMTVRAEITASPSNIGVYPVGGFDQFTINRLDIHTFATDTGTALRTSEDQDSPNNRANFRIDLANIDFPNPDPFITNSRAVRNPVNTDARPKADVVVTFNSSDVNEGQLTYYVLVKGQKVYPSGAQPSDRPIRVIYATNPNRAEYYRNPHYVEVVGQDDQAQDGDQQFLVTATGATSTDPEYRIPLALPFVFVNTDNEQNQTSGPGYIFSKTTLNTDEAGQEDTFTTSLRTRPRGNVTINLRSTRVDEVLFVNPNNPNGPLLNNLNITYLANGTGDGRTTTFYETPLVITVRGVDDQRRDNDQSSLIRTSVVSSADSAYGSIDPPDLLSINADDEGNGITVFPTVRSVNENATTTFTVRLNAKPTADVDIDLTSSDPSVATIVGPTTLTFTRDNFGAQTVTVRGVPSGGFNTQRTATIVTSPASSADRNFDGLVVADVVVTVRGNNSAFVVNAPAAGLSTSEIGGRDIFTVSLGQAPTANVQLILSANPASEVRLSRTAAAGTPSVTLNFTPANYATPQTVNAIGQDDLIADGDKAFTIGGRVITTDTLYAQQQFTPVAGVNFDNESGTGGGGGGGGQATSPNFAANSTYTFSMPYATSSAAKGSIAVKSLFTNSAVKDFKIYRYDVANQVNSRLIGEDFKVIASNGTIQRGVGYILQTGATALTLRTPPATKAFAGSTFSIALTRNKKFVATTGQANSNNGLNFIGFPFDPSQFSSVSFTTATVKVGTETYASIREAAAAGVISDKLYTTNARGQLTEVPSGSQVLRPYGAYFVRIYRDSVTLTFNSPAAN